MPFTPFAVHGVPAGGTTGQVLSKASDDNWDDDWEDAGGGPTQSYAVACLTTVDSQYSIPAQHAGWLPLTSQLVAGTDLTIHDDEIHIETDGWYEVLLQVYASFSPAANMSLFFTVAGSAVAGNPLLNILTMPLGMTADPNTVGTEQAGSVTTPPVFLHAGNAVHMFLTVDLAAGVVGLNTNNDATTQLAVQRVG